jgi:putrescine transport system ATP-binding protein
LIEDEPDHVRLDCAEIGGTIYVNHGVSTPPDATLWAAIRPEKMHISTTRPQQTDNIAQGIVKEIAYMGDMSIYLVQLEGGKIVRITQPNTYRHSEESITWDQPVFLSWHASSPVVLSE